MKKIVFVTTHNLATNPRVYKEAQLALLNNFKVEIVCFEFNNWSYTYNQELKQKLNAAIIHTIPAGRKPLFPWLTSSMAEWFYQKLGYFIDLPSSLLSRAVSKRSGLLVKKLNKIGSADLVIAHNPGALWPAIWLAKKINAKVGFDMEDYHPGEGNDNSLQKKTALLLKRLLPLCNYVSFAAPLIKEETEALIKAGNKNWFTILNYFPAQEFTEPVINTGGKVKLVWFSQNISAGRGLEQVLPFMKQLGDKLELHLIGNMQSSFAEQFFTGLANVIIHPPCNQQELHRLLSTFDIGLALDMPVDRNRELAITNKILAYLQAGLYVVATDIPAHKELIEEFTGNGTCFSKTPADFLLVMEKVINDAETIRLSKKKRYSDNRKLSWENESVMLLQQWNQLTNAR